MSTRPVSDNLTWHGGDVDRAERARRLGQKGACVWLTGLSGSGKSTLAVALERALLERGVHAYRLDGDNVRHGLNRDLGFSADDRTENIRRIGEVARLFADAHVIVLASFISPYRADRARVRRLHEEAGLAFLEAHVHVPLEVAEERDPKGLYKKARSGEIKQFTGLDAPYEPPENPEIVLPTDRLSVEQSVQRIVDALDRAELLTAQAGP